ncbi:MAG: hypothetical protein HY805_03905 [Nitrospirae bacterium]|nr:hypothetical protein [Nitrospirota bacterium]
MKRVVLFFIAIIIPFRVATSADYIDKKIFVSLTEQALDIIDELEVSLSRGSVTPEMKNLEYHLAVILNKYKKYKKK